jgi:hypothetical protein
MAWEDATNPSGLQKAITIGAPARLSSAGLDEVAKTGSSATKVTPTEECKGVITNKIRQRRETYNKNNNLYKQQEHQATQPRILALNKIDKQKDHIINQQNYIF